MGTYDEVSQAPARITFRNGSYSGPRLVSDADAQKIRDLVFENVTLGSGTPATTTTVAPVAPTLL